MIQETNLPIEQIIPELRRVLALEGSAVLEAPPGAGKTSIVPLALLGSEWLKGGRIIMLEPRRLAAKAAATRMAWLLGEEPGETVGYRTRLDSKVGPSTRIEVVTEGILTRFLQNDPSLKGTGLVIFDEFHERSVHADLGLALVLDTRSILREDLRVLVMSATLDGGEISALLDGARVLKSTGRAYPVTVRYSPGAATGARDEWLSGPSFISRVTGAVFTALTEETGSVLVFLPGSGEIKRTEDALKLKGLPKEVEVVPLYGDLSREAQNRAIRPVPPGMRKVVLATSIAETSLTIDGIRVVVDGGLKRVPRFNPSTGMSSLATIRVSKHSAEQRSGRAGRVEPGVAVRLWAEGEHRALLEKNTPEIMEADLAPLALELAIWGVKDPSELKWIDPPPLGAMAHARDLLTRLGAIDHAGVVTGHGRRMARLPLHPRLAHMVIRAMGLSLGSLACYLSALLEERDFFRSTTNQRDSDIRHRLEVLLGRHGHALSQETDKGLLERIRSVARRLKKDLDIRDSSDDVELSGVLLAFAYPDRIGKRRGGSPGRYLLANGRGAYFAGPEGLYNEEYIVAASLDGGEKESRVFLAAPVREASLMEYFSTDIEESESVEWDQAQKGVAARKRRSLWGLVLSEARIQDAGKDKVLEAMISGVRLNGLGVLPWDRASENLRARINLLSSLSGETGAAFQPLSDEWMLEHLDEWLAPWLDGMTRLEHLKRLDLSVVILGTMKWEERQALDRLAPTHMTVPSGSRVHIDYTSGPRPVLAVRLQEMFGLDKTPAVANGRVPLLLHLLSPAGRPVQVTEDLAGFWATSYHQVRKELKGRYPKHYWPEDPMSSEPTRGAKKRHSPDK